MPSIFTTDITQEFYTRERCHIVEILNLQACNNLSIAQARVEPGVTTELHRLDVGEAYYILEGQGRIFFNDMDQIVKTGDVVFFPAGTPQQITNTGASDLRFLCICTPRFTPESYKAITPE